jgi:hypothetical protein
MPEEYKIAVVVVLLAIVTSLGNALYHMSAGPEHSARTVRALTVRISLSIALFLLLLAGWYFGLITPQNVHP